jgi:LTXXQ motif family protein
VAHRHFAANNAFAPFANNNWHSRNYSGGYGSDQGGYGGYGGYYGGWNGGWSHLGWIGPLFWPYGYGDVFYSALWPYQYGYVDPVWAYGYNDIYEGIFAPYSYVNYVRGPQAQARMTALSQQMSEACTNEAIEVTNWPIDQIQQVVQPDEQQQALLNDLTSAISQASDEIKSQCPTNIAFTPVERLAQMEQRLQGLLQAVNIVSPALNSFYDSLSAEQKARFNAMGAPEGDISAPNQQSANVGNPQTSCDGNVLSWPTDQIDQNIRPTAAQRAQLQLLQSAAAQASEIIKAACPSETPSTPPARLEAVGYRLQAILQAVQTVEPPLRDFYASLDDEQQARFNTLGTQIVTSAR